MKKVFKKDFARRVYDFVYEVEQFDSTGKSGGLFPALFKLISATYLAEEGDLFRLVDDSFVPITYTDYKLKRCKNDSDLKILWQDVASRKKIHISRFRELGIPIGSCLRFDDEGWLLYPDINRINDLDL